MPLTIIADIRAEAGREDLVHAELAKLVAPTRAEAGCLQYDLHRAHEDGRHFFFYETWEDRDLWQAHMAAPHIASYLAATEGAVASFTVTEMERVA
ncbi:putative quinol monooxygenase [Jannaschia aquimarina]|uniref:Putative monooxygenase n=1 Tax=Jannaschia aquimarina TaxID=935700 RepID=A0A0D1CPC5_9RHOB|nr:putative quinol monooxygenase [Jannaschia aquimarina]KIT16617.1 putative monooxygenase [Jannaschia aquimarina]SNT42625.1 Quinol monooxygenase YgiN [Jannaschia aquimarina]